MYKQKPWTLKANLQRRRDPRTKLLPNRCLLKQAEENCPKFWDPNFCNCHLPKSPKSSFRGCSAEFPRFPEAFEIFRIWKAICLLKKICRRSRRCPCTNTRLTDRQPGRQTDRQTLGHADTQTRTRSHTHTPTHPPTQPASQPPTLAPWHRRTVTSHPRTRAHTPHPHPHAHAHAHVRVTPKRTRHPHMLSLVFDVPKTLNHLYMPVCRNAWHDSKLGVLQFPHGFLPAFVVGMGCRFKDGIFVRLSRFNFSGRPFQDPAARLPRKPVIRETATQRNTDSRDVIRCDSTRRCSSLDTAASMRCPPFLRPWQGAV